MYNNSDELICQRLVRLYQAAETKSERDAVFSRLVTRIEKCGVIKIACTASKLSKYEGRQVCLIALWRAAERYDPEKSHSFIAYSIMKMRFDLKKAHTTSTTQRLIVHVPRDKMGDYNKLCAKFINVTEKLGHEPDEAEAAMHGIDSDKFAWYDHMRRFEKSGRWVFSIDDDAGNIVDEDDFVVRQLNFDNPDELTYRQAMRMIARL